MLLLEKLIANTWNRTLRLFKRRLTGGLALGSIVVDGRAGKVTYFLPQLKRAEHIVILGKTGQGKSFLILNLCLQDIRSGRGFVIFDPHGSLIPLILQAVAVEEKRTGKDLSSKLIVIEPGNPLWSVGFNPLEVTGGQQNFVLHCRYHLNHQGTMGTLAFWSADRRNTQKFFTRPCRQRLNHP
jgi:hypothetical protein